MDDETRCFADTYLISSEFSTAPEISAAALSRRSEVESQALISRSEGRQYCVIWQREGDWDWLRHYVRANSPERSCR
jgi:hypothetical protein